MCGILYGVSMWGVCVCVCMCAWYVAYMHGVSAYSVCMWCIVYVYMFICNVVCSAHCDVCGV